ncbi:alpha/beta fold hydrolase [Amycolatopsis pigmentata]|uniref:Alpha/beta fold hydrolase n=1 Tax=Amycolatopsis pigmentata TaxID=450801 RepID=A0ABW5FR89_9PSEU
MTSPTIIEVAGRATRVRVDGDPTAPPLVLLHGLNRSLEDWSAVVVDLASDHRVISLDVPGFGFSDRRPEPASLTSFALGVLETLDQLGETRPVHLLGNSLGGAVALQIQATASERVASLALADSAGFGAQAALMLRLISVPGLGHLMTARTTPFSAKMSERAIHADPAVATPERIEHALAIAKRPGPGAVTREIMSSLATIRGVRAEWRRELFAAIAQHPRPTLVMWGAKDRVLPPAHLDAVPRLIPHARTHTFPEVGHMPQIERPTAFVEVVRGFLADEVPTSTTPKRTTRRSTSERAGS